MTDTLDPLFNSGMRRESVLCTMCGTAWDDRVVAEGVGVEDEISLCPACLLTTSHGEPFDPERVAEPAGDPAPTGPAAGTAGA